MNAFLDLMGYLGRTYTIAFLLVLILIAGMFTLDEAIGISAWQFEVYKEGLVNGPSGPILQGDFPVSIEERDCWIFEKGDTDYSNGIKCPPPEGAYLLFTRLGILYREPTETCDYDGKRYPCVYFPSIPGKLDRPRFIWEIGK